MCFLLVIALLTACTCRNSEKKVKYGDATKELIKMVENDQEIKSMLVSSIEKARQINPDVSRHIFDLYLAIFLSSRLCARTN